jgi:ferredoxin/flavodoxin---NADP+ reductase
MTSLFAATLQLLPMTTLGTPDNPLRVAIIGSGPSAFYAAEHLQKQTDLTVMIDMYDRLPTPFGLVRGGVAPDHQKIKSVTKIYEGIAAKPGFRFFGNVEFGTHIKMADIQAHYHQILFANGAQSDRKMGIPGEDLKNSYPATQFVAWYNGHPDYADMKFDLSVEAVAVVGVGNVAIDVARILVRTPDELRATDIAPHALEALTHSKVKTVYLLGRRGPAQAAFTNPEVKELGEMQDAEPVVIAEEVALDPLSAAAIADDRTVTKKVEILQGYAARHAEGKANQLRLRFLVSPVELIGDEHGAVKAMKLVKNVLVAGDGGDIKAKATDQTEIIDVGLVFRSVGYRGVALAEVPFDDKSGRIPNEKGRVLNTDKTQAVGLYTAGWIKRGPSGVIGTNKPDSVETVEQMVADAKAGVVFAPTGGDIAALVAERQPEAVSMAGWKKIDAAELANGAASGRPRVKFVRVADMVAAARG